MKRAVIIYRIDKSNIANTGVINKLQGQVEGLKNCNYKVDYVIHDKEHIYLNQTVIHSLSKLENKTYSNYRFYKRLNKLTTYELYIIRYGVATRVFNSWIKKIRASNPNCKIIIDMPTYPYESEWKGLKGKLVLWMDRNNNRNLKKYVDLVLHSGDENKIFGIPTYQMSNGVNESQLSHLQDKKKSSILTMVAIGKWQYWHGLDRLFQGFKNYGQAVKLHIIGEGPETDGLKKLSIQLGIEDKIQWYGNVTGKRMVDICRKADIGIGTLGIHRKNVKIDSSLKHRTYCAMGLPFILGGVDTDFSEDLSFIQYVPANESPIDITEVSSFVAEMDNDDVQEEMIRYARTNLLWTSKMKKLIADIEAA